MAQYIEFSEDVNEILLRVGNPIFVLIWMFPMVAYDKSRLLETVEKNERLEVKCLKRVIGVPTCYDKQNDMKSIIALLTG